MWTPPAAREGGRGGRRFGGHPPPARPLVAEDLRRLRKASPGVPSVTAPAFVLVVWLLLRLSCHECKCLPRESAAVDRRVLPCRPPAGAHSPPATRPQQVPLPPHGLRVTGQDTAGRPEGEPRPPRRPLPAAARAPGPSPSCPATSAGFCRKHGALRGFVFPRGRRGGNLGVSLCSASTFLSAVTGLGVSLLSGTGFVWYSGAWQ